MSKEKKPVKEVESAAPVVEKKFLVRWKGGEEEFTSLGMAEVAARSRVGGYIV